MVTLRKSDARRALMLIEAAFVLPILLGVTFLLLQYGWLFLRAEQIANAARHGVRRAIVADATEGEVRSEVQKFLAASGITNGVQTTITPRVDADKGELITVTVSVTVAGNSQIDILGFSGLADFRFPVLPARLRSAVSMAKERS